MFAANDVAKAIEKLVREIVAAELGRLGACPSTHSLVMKLEQLIAETKRK